MRTISALAVILIGNCLVRSLEAKDIVMDKSPDGNFALRIQLNRNLPVSFKPGYRIDGYRLAHDQAPKRVSAGISRGSPVISAVSAE